MNLNAKPYVLPLDPQDPLTRWHIYDRLQQLGIICNYYWDRPLLVQIRNALDAVQVRSVVRHSLDDRQDCVHWLERCWTLQP